MRSPKRVISNVSETAHTDVHNRNPALQLMVSCPVTPIRHANRERRPGCFDAREERFIIDDTIAQQAFINAPASEVLCGCEVERANSPHSGKQHHIRLVPERVGFGLAARDAGIGRRCLGWCRVGVFTFLGSCESRNSHQKDGYDCKNNCTVCNLYRTGKRSGLGQVWALSISAACEEKPFQRLELTHSWAQARREQS